MIRTCKVCGTRFAGARNAHYCMGCKEDRVRALRAESKRRQRDGSARRIGGREKCAVCAAPYILRASGQKYCGIECAAIGLKDYYVRRYQANKKLTSD